MPQSSDSPERASIQQPDTAGSGAVSQRYPRTPRSSSMQPVQQRLRQSGGRLAQLVAQSDRLARINRAFRAYLPPHLHDHVKLVTFAAQTWIIQAESAAWATRLRYLLPSLQQQLSEHLGHPVPKLTIKIQPFDHATEAATPSRRLQVTEKSAAVLEGAAQGVNDKQLGAALLRLAQHARQRAQN